MLETTFLILGAIALALAITVALGEALFGRSTKYFNLQLRKRRGRQHRRKR